jgi:hypothetical protein
MGIKFNSNKSNAIVFGKPVIKNVHFYLKNEEIMFKEKLKILGYEFNSKNINEMITLLINFQKLG